MGFPSRLLTSISRTDNAACTYSHVCFVANRRGGWSTAAAARKERKSRTFHIDPSLLLGRGAHVDDARSSCTWLWLLRETQSTGLMYAGNRSFPATKGPGGTSLKFHKML